MSKVHEALGVAAMYEFAERIGTKPVWDAFVEKYPSGFFTALAKAPRDKLAAEATRIEATNKAKAAQEEQARLALEGAKAAEQAKAAGTGPGQPKKRVSLPNLPRRPKTPRLRKPNVQRQLP